MDTNIEKESLNRAVQILICWVHSGQKNEQECQLIPTITHQVHEHTHLNDVSLTWINSNEVYKTDFWTWRLEEKY